jgi:hypothetical protein
VLPDEPFELLGARAQFVVGELGCGAGRPRGDVRDAETELRQRDVLLGRVQARREAGRVQRRPEPVPRPGEVVPDLRRSEPGVDPDEEDP